MRPLVVGISTLANCKPASQWGQGMRNQSDSFYGRALHASPRMLAGSTTSFASPPP